VSGFRCDDVAFVLELVFDEELGAQGTATEEAGFSGAGGCERSSLGYGIWEI